MIWRIAKEEWRLWTRSRVIVIATLIVAVLIGATSVLTLNRVTQEQAQRLTQQVTAEQNFFAQPDRHPHRMVHYGHYAFRAPPPLAAFDPGVDAVTGQSIFLEGHRQNTAMFADARAAADMGGFAALTPANLYQLLLPLLLIVIGHGLLLRERESGTLAVLLAQGQSGLSLTMGKGVALLGVIAVFMLPLAALAVYSVVRGEAALAATMLTASYALYLCLWGALVLAVSTLVRERSVALGVLIFVWLLAALVVPRIGINASSAAIFAPGKIESDLIMASEQRELSDGHDAADPGAGQLQQQLLEQYEVDSVEELPVNLRGVRAGRSEAELTEVLNTYAEDRMLKEARQSGLFTLFGLASPAIAIGSASRALAGTDLATHHRFLRESEALRFSFVQSLNDVHATQLSYVADTSRNTSEEALALAKVGSDAWQVLDAFRFTPDAASLRLQRAVVPLAIMLVWLAALAGVVVVAARRLKP